MAKPASLSTVYECTEGAMWVDTTKPTDIELHVQRPDLILYINVANTIWNKDVGCTWEPLIEEREGENIGKYEIQKIITDIQYQTFMAAARFLCSHLSI